MKLMVCVENQKNEFISQATELWKEFEKSTKNPFTYNEIEFRTVNLLPTGVAHAIPRIHDNFPELDFAQIILSIPIFT